MHELCLLGPRHLASHLQFAEDCAVAAGGAPPDPAAIAEAWRSAAAAYRGLEVSEAGAADDPQISALPKPMEAHVRQLVALPAFRHSFDTVPVAFGMVELDRLIVSQYSLTSSIVARLRERCAARLSKQQLAHVCLPLAPPEADFKFAGRHGREFVFTSGAHDMRFLGASVVDPAQVQGLHVQGHVKAVVALAVGFSSNVLSAVRFGNRLVLGNGHHRAHALRSMGWTHVPCVIQVCASYAELRQAATSEIYDHSDLYFESPRPPLLRDFDHPGLTQTLSSGPMRRHVRVRFKVDSRQWAV